MNKIREQKIIDSMFEIIMSLHYNKDFFYKHSRQTIADWVAIQLKECGFPTRPMGSSWAVLIDDESILTPKQRLRNAIDILSDIQHEI